MQLGSLLSFYSLRLLKENELSVQRIRREREPHLLSFLVEKVRSLVVSSIFFALIPFSNAVHFWSRWRRRRMIIKTRTHLDLMTSACKEEKRTLTFERTSNDRIEVKGEGEQRQRQSTRKESLLHLDSWSSSPFHVFSEDDRKKFDRRERKREALIDCLIKKRDSSWKSPHLDEGKWKTSWDAGKEGERRSLEVEGENEKRDLQKEVQEEETREWEPKEELSCLESTSLNFLIKLCALIIIALNSRSTESLSPFRCCRGDDAETVRERDWGGHITLIRIY